MYLIGFFYFISSSFSSTSSSVQCIHQVFIHQSFNSTSAAAASPHLILCRAIIKFPLVLSGFCFYCFCLLIIWKVWVVHLCGSVACLSPTINKISYQFHSSSPTKPGPNRYTATHTLPLLQS